MSAARATVHTAGPDDLAPATLYRVLQLRVAVFVVEQRCPYPELDGRDLEAGARHCWITEQGEVVACMRLLAEPDGSTRLGRLATAPAARGRGHAATLVRHGLRIGTRPMAIDAQSHLADFYGAFGFAVSGPEFIEDGIAHLPMRLDI